MASFNVKDFILEPTVDKIINSTPKKCDWRALADHYGVEIYQDIRKQELKDLVLQNLVDSNIISTSALGESSIGTKSQVAHSQVEKDREFWLHMFKLETEREEQKLRLEKEKEVEKLRLEREKEIERRETIEAEERRYRAEMAKLDLELQLARVRQQDNTSYSTRNSEASMFDVSKASRMVPSFDEKDPETFFRQFEKTATTLDWQQDYWTILLQTVLKGKAAQVYSNLSLEDSKNYDLVKQTVLTTYELTVEGYRQGFRNMTKQPEHTFVEFAAHKQRAFDKWLNATKVNDFEKLKNLMLMEEFKRRIPHEIKLHLEDREITELSKAATTADSYSLIHRHTASKNENKRFVKSICESAPRTQNGNHKPHVSSNVSTSFNQSKSMVCAYCRQEGHSITSCPDKRCKASVNFSTPTHKDTKPKAQHNVKVENSSDHKSASTFSRQENKAVDSISAVGSTSNDKFAPFKFPGKVSLPDQCGHNVTILRDTASDQSLIIKSALPGVEKAYTGETTVVEDLSGKPGYPLAKVHLDSDLISGEVVLGVRDKPFPAKEAQVLLSNDLAGPLVVPNMTVVRTPVSVSPTLSLEQEYPDLFPSCAVTTRQQARNTPLEPDVDFSVTTSETFSNLPISRDNLIQAQKSDPFLTGMFHKALDNSTDNTLPIFYLEDGLLMRKFRPIDSPSEEWATVTQIVVPTEFRKNIISLAHDGVHGHLGVKKTHDKILANFFWPRMRKDISSFIQSCHTCQLVGKPNKPIPRAPLHPILVEEEPFHKVIVDCVGPLPKTRLGNQYLLTVMCATTRFPEAIPLRNIQTKSITKALIKMFTQYGIPRVVQSDQGTNFSSDLFSSVMKELGIEQYQSTPYHPESQGALERFHQTLKQMIRKFCLDTQADWDEGIPMLLFAVRDSKQESLGFSPFEMLFGREVRGPLRVLRETWCSVNPSVKLQTVSQYVQKLKETLAKVHDIARSNLKSSQATMKSYYDKKSKVRSFSVGENVLVYLPIQGSPLSAKYSGPYSIKDKIDDLNYVIATPDRRRKSKKVHINLIKKYYHRDSQVDCTENSNTSKLSTTLTVPSMSAHAVSHNDKIPLETSTGCDLPLNNSLSLQKWEEKSTHLTPSQKDDVYSILQKFPSITRDQPGECNLIQHDITLINNARPIKQSPYRVNPEKRRRLHDAVQYLLDNNLAEPSSSPWASPCLLVPKPDGSDRLCTDFRKVNQVTQADSYPLPRLDDLVDSVGNAKYVSKVDLQKGYYQIPLSSQARLISAFVTPDGLYQYTRMPFGLKNAPGTFQRVINYVLRDLDGVFAYLDDILIVSDSWDDHLVKLTDLFTRLSTADLTINLQKSEFGRGTVIYLGHEVGQGRTRPKTAKVEALLSFPQPKTRRSLRRFLGMAGFYRHFCVNFSVITAPLTDILSPKRPYVWTEECQAAFDKVKSLLSSEPVLHTPDFSRQFELQVDASDKGCGAVLLQLDPDSNILHPVAYYSKKFRDGQLNYSTIEKECLSIILALEKFEVYVKDTVHSLIIRTDHNPIKFINSMKNQNQRLMRWSLLLQEYNIEIRHIKGTQNILADTLSRVYCDVT